MGCALPGRGIVTNQTAERKATFIRSRSNSVGDDRSHRASCDLIAAYSLGLTQESLFKHIPARANVALKARVPNVREKRSSSVSDCEPYHGRRVKSPTPEELIRLSALRRGPFDGQRVLESASPKPEPQPSSTTKLCAQDSRKKPIVPTLPLDAGRPNRSSTEPARTPPIHSCLSKRNLTTLVLSSVGTVLPPLSFRSASFYNTSSDSLDSLASGGSTCSGLSPRYLQLSNQMSRAYFLEFILHDKKARQAFKSYLEKRHCVENLMFWLDVERFKKLGTLPTLHAIAMDLLNTSKQSRRM